jgi:hypothetical protein
VFENGVMVENQTTTGLDTGGQRFIRGNDIFIFEFESSFSALQSSNPTLITSPDRNVQETVITGFDDGSGKQDIKIELNTTLSANTWSRLLSNQQHVLDVSDNGDSVIITLDGQEDYTVHTGKALIER